MKPVFIIAEAGVNHNGDIELAKQLIDVAADAGADAIKFQTFKTENIVASTHAKADYQKKAGNPEESQAKMLKKLELTWDAFRELNLYTKQKGIQFLSTAFDKDSTNFLEDLNVPLHKIPSGEITNLPYLRYLGGLGKPIIISTGMASLGEIEEALTILYNSGVKTDDITILHCNTEYPTPFSDVNLKAMLTIRSAFPGIQIGYSDHTLGTEVSIAAVAMGATIIEKHFTLDCNMDGPDHQSSLEPNQLKHMINAIRNIEQSLGNGWKRPSQSEIKNIRIARRSIIASTFIRKGEKFTEFNITTKRAGFGISPMKWDEILGQISPRDFGADECIKL